MTAPTPLRVMLVDDHGFVRSAIRQAIEGPEIEVVAEASTAADALVLGPEHRPDIVLLDIDLPGSTGLRVLRELAPRLPETRFVMLTVSTSPRDVLEAVRLGASGYLTKDLDPAALRRAVIGVANGDLAMPRRMAARAMKDLVDAARTGSRGGGDPLQVQLSDRETEVLRLLAGGMTDREIGEELSISIRTVETHVSNILRKLGARNRAEAARRYAAEG